MVSLQSPPRTSPMMLLATAAILTASVVYGVLQFQVFQAEKQAIMDNEFRRQELDSVLAQAEKTYQTLAQERTKKQAELGQRLFAILPQDENYTDLTRQLDEYFSGHDKPNNPILQSSLRFGKGAPVPDLPDVSALPVSMNVEATRDNFLKFLQYVSGSGSLEQATRLMDLDSIQLNFPEGGEVVKDLSQKINFTVDMNAYYLTPKVPR